MADPSKIQVEIETILKGVDAAEKGFRNLFTQLENATRKMNTGNTFSSFSKELKGIQRDFSSFFKDFESLYKRALSINTTTKNPFSQIFSRKDVEAFKDQIATVRILQDIMSNPQKMASKQWGERFGGFLTKEITNIGSARESMKMADDWIRMNRSIADPSLVTAVKKFRDEMNLIAHGLEKNRLSIRNFSLSLGIMKRDIVDLIMWQARWYGSKALLFTPLQGIQRGVKDFMEWEQAIKNVEAVSQPTREELKKLEEVTLEIGRTTPISAKEASKAMLEFAQAGVDVETIQKALPVSAKMVVATQEDIKTAVSALTTIYNVWKTDAKDMEKVGGMLASSMADSKLKVADLSTVFNYLATTSNLAGISLQDVLTLVTALSKAGVKASTIGTGLSNFISRMTNIKGNWKKELEGKGINIAEVLLPENDILTVLKRLKSAGVDIISLFKGLEMRAGRTGGALLSMVDELDSISSKVKAPGMLDKIFGIAASGIENQLKEIANLFQNIFIEIGRGNAENFRSLLGLVKDFIFYLELSIRRVDGFNTSLNNLSDAAKILVAALRLIKDTLGVTANFVVYGLSIGFTIATESINFFARSLTTVIKVLKELSVLNLAGAWKEIKDWSEKSRESTDRFLDSVARRGSLFMQQNQQRGKEMVDSFKSLFGDYTEKDWPMQGSWGTSWLSKTEKKETASRDNETKEKIKKSFREQLSLEEKARKDELTLTKSFNDLKMSILDNARKLNLLSEEKYYEQSIETAKENFDNDIRIAEATYAQFEKGGKIYEEYLNDKELEKDSTKQLQLDQRFLTEKREAEIKVLTLQNDKTKELLRLYTEEEARIQKVADEYAKLYEVSYDIAEQTKAQTEKGISERQIVTNEYLYGKMKISSEKYYNEEYDRIELDLRHAKDAAVRKADIAIAEANRRLRGQDPGILIKEEEKINEEKNKEINAAEETALKERLNLHYKYLEDLRALYQSKGTAAVTGKILEDLSIQSLDMANNLKSAVESISSSMESAFMDFLDHTSEGFLKWENLVTNVLNEITKELIKVYIVKQLIGGIQGVIGGWFSSGETDVAGLQNLMPGGYRASGGPVSLNRAYLVGEQGPELFVPNSNGNIVPNNKLNTGSNVQVNVINQTSRPVEGRQSEAKFDGEKWVVGVVLKELTNNYGPLRHAVKGVR